MREGFLECSGSFSGYRGVGVRRISRISLMKIILGIEMHRTPSKAADFSPLVSPARGVTSRARVDRRRRLARGFFFMKKKFDERFSEFECRWRRSIRTMFRGKFQRIWMSMAAVNQENVSKKISGNLNVDSGGLPRKCLDDNFSEFGGKNIIEYSRECRGNCYKGRRFSLNRHTNVSILNPVCWVYVVINLQRKFAVSVFLNEKN